MIPASQILNCGFALAADLSGLLMQISEQTSKNLEPDRTTHMKLSAMLGFLGLIVLITGMFLMLWLISRYARRNLLRDSSPGNSPFAEFSYKHRDQFKDQSHDDDAPPSGPL